MIRVSKGWLQSDLSRKSNLTQAAISQLESGLRKPTLVALHKLCKALDVTEEDLIGKTDLLKELRYKINQLSPSLLEKVIDYVDYIIYKNQLK